MQSFQDRILKTANAYLQEKYGFGFWYDLIGSAGRGLVTEDTKGNKGWDLDYNLIIESPNKIVRSWYGNLVYVQNPNDNFEFRDEARKIKEMFREAFNYAVDGTEYDFPEDSSSVLTLKCKDVNTSRILYGADLAIVYYDNRGIMHTLEHYKPRGPYDSDGYGFQIRNVSFGIEDKLGEILEFLDDGWYLIAEEYLKLKNSNKDPDKKSRILYMEAVHNVRNNFDQEIYDEMDRQGYFGNERE